jgi:hypothetical protein
VLRAVRRYENADRDPHDPDAVAALDDLAASVGPNDYLAALSWARQSMPVALPK